ncbi:MAG: ABC transporter ATP-binding protein [Chloroflexota bacterium]|nr:ABC transporter ATP-binding protein [Chloroflexota bacterium]
MSYRARKFLSFYRPYLGTLALDLLCAFIVSAITLILPLCVRHITQNLLGAGVADPIGEIGVMAMIMLALVLAHTLCTLFVDYQGHMMGAKMERDMRRELFAHYQKLSFSFYDDQKTGQLMSRITSDLFAISELAHHGPEDLFLGIVKFIGVFLITLSINPALSLIVIAFLPFMFLFSLHFNRKMNRAMRLSKERVAQVNAQVEDSLAGIRVVQSFANEDWEQAKFDEANARFVESRRLEYKSEGLFYGGMEAFTQLMTVVVVVFGAIAITRAALDLSDLITFLLYVGILIEPIRRLVNFARWYQEGITGFHRFMDMIELPPAIQDPAPAHEPELVRGELELQRVSFGYRADFGTVLRDLSLKIGSGEYVALVGASGVGKTTISALIPRFYDADAGRICLDGVDIRQYSLRALRRNIGMVDQDVYLFGATVADNIRYGKPDATEEEIMDAAKKAYAHDFILELPQGYDTEIGQRGIKLSAGQRQRLSIARLFLKDPPLIILDEATSALDNESERVVQRSLERLIENRSTLVIAHRLSTIRNADRILVLTPDGICEQGSHKELLRADGVYANLHDMQLAR